ncbi:hypothetical protein QL217_09395 [Cronobacter malonaticus]|uniref:hypothetical protein n=1 Tax=Cronobacter malonaticus TaxID=413503 RepID=UPI0024AE5D2E|nr:hypothetical protein [Cronobacter malonaticus]ELL7784609.1 hypothetical protein [Cronobacter sakazakii]MDI6404981.1 hypothetical protein [Cronobacter malonaticus]
MNNDELIAAGHELAKCLDNEPLLDIAKLLSKMATQLDVTTAALREKTKQCEQLAAENAVLKSWAEKRAKSDDALEQERYSTLKIDYRQRMLSNIQTPATDAFLREVRAQGVEMFAKWCRGERDFTLIDEDIADAAAYDECVKRVDYFAEKLRQGGAA